MQMADDVPVTSPGAKHAVVRELYERFGQETFVFQSTLDDVPTLWVPREKLIEVLGYLRQAPKPYVMLLDLSAVDERLRVNRPGLPPSDFTVFYHLLSIDRNSDIRLKVALSADSLWVPTAIGIWPNANWYEREVWDLFGIHIEGHPHLYRILLPRNWVGHPLRKDYPRAPPNSIPSCSTPPSRTPSRKRCCSVRKSGA